VPESTDRVNADRPGTDNRPQIDALVSRARTGDSAALDDIVRLYQSAVYRAALAALGSPADAEEATQDAFVAAFRRLDSFRGEASFKTWLLAIAWRKALTRRRVVQIWRRRVAVAPTDNAPDPIDGVATSEPGPDVAVATAEMRREARRMISALPRKLRDTLLLAASGEYSYDEISAMLSIPLGTVKWRVSEARRIVRAKLKAAGY
jgi:RNA polymerase sigma-70 factor, ECF subfamily